MTAPVFVVHIDAQGLPEYLAFGGGDGRLLIVDERCPGDRVYAITRRLPRAELDALIGSDPIGDIYDGRTDPMMARLEAAIAGRRHLSVVQSDG